MNKNLSKEEVGEEEERNTTFKSSLREALHSDGVAKGIHKVYILQPMVTFTIYVKVFFKIKIILNR